MRYRFGDLELDAAAYTLRREGRELALQPKVFDVLLYLLEHRTRVIAKEELLDAVWSGEHVGDSTVPWSISRVRDVLGQTRGSKTPIETIHRRGYRFAAAVEVLDTQNVLTVAPTPKAASSAAQTKAVDSQPFVGRADVMQRLRSRLDDAGAGRGRLCLIYGEAGIGKTRCAQELIAHAVSLGFRARIGRAVEDTSAPVFWPWIQILREVARTQPEMRQACEPLLSRLAALDADADADGETPLERVDFERRFWLLDEITRALLLSAEHEKVVLLIDDLQWADVGTLDLLDSLAPELASAHMLVIGTLRDETTRGGQRRRARLARHAERIELSRLSVADVGRYFSEITDVEQPAALCAAVHRATAGNPLFVQETVRALVAKHGPAALRTLTPDDIKLLDVADDVLRMPLEALSAESRALLARASVLGESFELPLLQTLSELPLSSLLSLIESATQHGLIRAETPQRYRFAHGLIRRLLYDGIPTAERVGLHRQAAEALQALTSAEPRYNEIAHHFYRSLPAGAYDRVVAATQRAAQAAEAVLAYADAVSFYEWALEAQALDPSAGPRERAQLLFGCGLAQRYAGKDRDARHTLGRLCELARQHGYGDLLVRAARVLRPTVAMSGVPDSLVRGALEEALRIAPAGANAQRIAATSMLACVPPYSADMQRSKELSERALELARTLGEGASLYEALRSRLYSLSGPDDTDELLAVADEMLGLEHLYPGANIEAQSARYAALLYRGRTGEADRALAAVGDVARARRLPEAIWYYDRNRAQRAFLRGEFAAAKLACADLRARSVRMGLSYGEWFVDAIEALAAVEKDGLEAHVAGRDLSQFSADGPNLPANARARLVRTAAELGQRATAQAGLEMLVSHGLSAIPKTIGYLNTLATIAVAAVTLGDLECAEQVYTLLAPYPQHNTPDVLLCDSGSISRYLALLAASLGRRERVEAHFEEAIAMNQRMGRRPQTARTYMDYAQWLTREGHSARARDAAGKASAIARDSGMDWLTQRARELVS